MKCYRTEAYPLIAKYFHVIIKKVMNIRSEKMKNLTLKINDWDWINQELDQFLKTQTGIIDSITNIKKN